MPYKVSTWDTIPDDIKDPDGHWYGDYYGVMSFMVNKDLVPEAPADWADLLKPEYAGSVALSGDPKASNQAISAVHAAGLAAGRRAGQGCGRGRPEVLRRAERGRQLRAGDRQGRDAGAGRDADRDLLGLQRPDRARHAAGQPAGRGRGAARAACVAGVYVQAISAYAPHPNAAKLWMEYLYSDEGQLKWLEGYCHPIRFNDLAARGVIPQELLDKLPPGRRLRGRRLPDAGAAGRHGRRDQGELGRRRRRRPCPTRLRAPAARRRRRSPAKGRSMAELAVSTPPRRRSPDPGPGSASCRSWHSRSLFLILPTMHIVVGAFRSPAGEFTLQNIVNLFRPSILGSSGSRSGSASPRRFLGCVIGFCVAAAVVLGGLPRWLRGPVMTFSGVASNFAGVPLAFAFLATLGPARAGHRVAARVVRHQPLRARLQPAGLLGADPHLSLLPDPADDPDHHPGARRAEARVARGGGDPRGEPVPVLADGGAADPAGRRCSARWRCSSPTPSGRWRRPIALTGSSLTIVPILLFAQIRGDVLGDPHLGYALAFGMIVVTGLGNALYIWMRTRAERWIK